MKRVIGVLLTAMLLCTVLVTDAAAQTADELLSEQWEASGADELFEALPAHTLALLDTLGLDSLTLESLSQMTPQTVFSAFSELVSSEISAPLSATLTMLGTILLLGFVMTLRPMTGEHAPVMQAIGTLCAAVPLLLPLWQIFERVAAATDSGVAFSLGFAPVYAGMLLSGGYTATAVSYQTVMLAASEGISLLVGSVILPLLCVSAALGVAGAVDGGHRLTEVGTMIGKAAAWLLGISLTVFVAVLSFQSVLSASADTVGGRMLRFSVSGFVPIVGGSLSEALYTVKGCLATLRGTVGALGVLCASAIVLPTLVQCLLWNLLLFPVRLAADLFGFGTVAAVTEIVRTAVRTCVAVLCSSALLMIVALTVVTIAGGGAA